MSNSLRIFAKLTRVFASLDWGPFTDCGEEAECRPEFLVLIFGVFRKWTKIFLSSFSLTVDSRPKFLLGRLCPEFMFLQRLSSVLSCCFLHLLNPSLLPSNIDKFRAFKVCSKSLGCSTLLLLSFVKSEPSIPQGQVQHVCKNFWGHLQQNKVCMNSYIWWKSEVDYTVQGMIISDVLMHTTCGECEQISEYTVICR